MTMLPENANCYPNILPKEIREEANKFALENTVDISFNFTPLISKAVVNITSPFGDILSFVITPFSRPPYTPVSVDMLKEFISDIDFMATNPDTYPESICLNLDDMKGYKLFYDYEDGIFVISRMSNTRSTKENYLLKLSKVVSGVLLTKLKRLNQEIQSGKFGHPA